MSDLDSTAPQQKNARTTPRQREQRYYDVLRLIAKDFKPSERILERGDCGLSGPEALEMAYDNIQAAASAAIRGMRRPKDV